MCVFLWWTAGGVSLCVSLEARPGVLPERSMAVVRRGRYLEWQRAPPKLRMTDFRVWGVCMKW